MLILHLDEEPQVLGSIKCHHKNAIIPTKRNIYFFFQKKKKKKKSCTR